MSGLPPVWLTLRVLAVAAGSSDGIVDPDSGGQTAAFVLFLVAFVLLAVSSLTIVVPRFVPWVAGIISFVIAAGLTLLIQFGLDNIAWSLYGGLKVLRAPEVFNDLAWTLRWVACEGCEADATNHGVGLLWLKPLTLGHVSGEWAIPLGFLGIFAMSLALIWLAKESLPIGKLLISISAVSSAWLLLLDRANLDILVFLIPIAGVFLYRRSSGYWGVDGPCSARVVDWNLEVLPVRVGDCTFTCAQTKTGLGNSCELYRCEHVVPLTSSFCDY